MDKYLDRQILYALGCSLIMALIHISIGLLQPYNYWLLGWLMGATFCKIDNMILNNFKWYRKLRKGKWEYIYHKGISCEAWFRNRGFEISLQERIEKVEDYDSI